MISIIRIAGKINLNSRIKETLNRLRLKKKYACIVIGNPNNVQLGMIKLVRDFVAFGEINEETYKKLIEERGQLLDRKKSKPDAKKVIASILEGKKYEDFNLKPFFRLHPPRKGIDSKKHFGVKKGVLGNNKEKINDLILRML